MKILSYKTIIPNSVGVVDTLDRSGYMTQQYLDLANDYLSGLQLKGRVAFLYAGGVLLPASEARNVQDQGQYRVEQNQSGICIKELAAYSMHQWIGRIPGRDLIEHANINGNTCASSMYSLYEAEQLLNSGFDEVIIVSEEKTSYNTLRVFDEHGIDLKVGEGCVIVHLGKGADITDCKTYYEYNRNPFATTVNGYLHVSSPCDIVKRHGTGTVVNETAEDIVFDGKDSIKYKPSIGHTQGLSGLLELCMVMSDPTVTGDILCVSSGLGGFYASAVLHKRR